MHNLFRWPASAMALGFSWAALAQPARTDAQQSTASAPQLQHRSAFADYKPYKEVPLANWRAVNDALAGSASAPAGHTMPGMQGMGQMRPITQPPKKPEPKEAAHGTHPMPGAKQ